MRTGRGFIVTIPAPGAKCSPNFKGHWAAKGRDGKRSRDDSYISALAAKPPKFQKATVSVVWTLGAKDGSYRPKDRQNAISALKWAIDGCVDAGVIPDDTAHHLKWGDVEIRRVKGGKTEVELTFMEDES